MKRTTVKDTNEDSPLFNVYYYKTFGVAMCVCMFVCLGRIDSKALASNRMPSGTKLIYVPGKVLDYFDFDRRLYKLDN